MPSAEPINENRETKPVGYMLFSFTKYLRQRLYIRRRRPKLNGKAEHGRKVNDGKGDRIPTAVVVDDSWVGKHHTKG